MHQPQAIALPSHAETAQGANRPPALSLCRVARWATAALICTFVLSGCQSVPTQLASLTPPADKPASEAPARNEPAGNLKTPPPTPSVPPTPTAPVSPGAPYWPKDKPTPLGQTMYASPANSANPAAVPTAMRTPQPRDAVPTDLWERIRTGYALAPLAGSALQNMDQQLRWYQANPGHAQRVFTRGKLYLFDIVEQLDAAGVPLEIALLPAVESAFNPKAVSSASADGLWQFMGPTGKRFELRQHSFVDERRHVRLATEAAVRYLTTLAQRYNGDWQLALAAYNCGEGCIDKAVARAKAKGLPGRFEDLSLNPETRQYVPRLYALAQLVLHAAADAQALPAVDNSPYYLAIPITQDLDVAAAAKMAGMSVGEFRTLNPQHKKPVIVAAVSGHVFVPTDKAERFTLALRASGQQSSWQLVKLGKRSSIEALAKTYGATPEQLRSANGIPAGKLVLAQSSILVPVSPFASASSMGKTGRLQSDAVNALNAIAGGAQLHAISAQAAASATLATADAVVRRKVTLRKGEGWPAAAKALGIPVQTLQKYNPHARLKRGVNSFNVPALALQT